MSVEVNTIEILQKWQAFSLNALIFCTGMRIVITILKVAGV
jgi:hypothetical protein